MTKTTFLSKRARMFIHIYLSFSIIMLSIVGWLHGLEASEHATTLITWIAMDLAFGLEHLYHWSTRKRHDP